MSKTNIEQALEICNRFSDTNPINFYELFEINKNMSLAEINRDIKNKRIRIIFHPDQVAFIPDEYKKTFQKISDSITDLIDVFSSEKNKEKYDSKLSKSTARKNETKTAQEIRDFENAIIITAQKHGWKHMIEAISKAIHNDFYGFTRNGNARNIVKSLGANKIKSIILDSSIFELDNEYRINEEQMIANYLSDMFFNNQILEKQALALQYAIEQTFNKYGNLQVYKAINKYATIGDPYGITGDGNARNELRYHVRPQDVHDILIFINNRNRFVDPANYYINSKDQSLEYQVGLYLNHITKINHTYNGGHHF